jgi:sensor histidine kinase YesM
MKKFTLNTLTDQKNLSSHISILLVSIFLTVYYSFARDAYRESGILPVFFLWFFIQIEVFLLLARMVFGKFDQSQTRSQITKTFVVRFLVFYITCLAAAFVLYLTFRGFIGYRADETLRYTINSFFRNEFRSWFNSTTAGIIFGGIVLLIVLWQDALRREQKLREQNLIFQNETLRNQVNPHFLFNSLNTISALIHTEPRTAEYFINNLSSFYRYILENGQKDRVSLQSELDFVSGYINLHKVRDEEKIQFSAEVPDKEKFSILPVSLQILVENAIKHNIATRENQLRIIIYVEDQFIVVKNNLQRKASQLHSIKTGLKNLAERTRLISGKEMVIEETNDYFKVKLPLLV